MQKSLYFLSCFLYRGKSGDFLARVCRAFVYGLRDIRANAFLLPRRKDGADLQDPTGSVIRPGAPDNGKKEGGSGQSIPLPLPTAAGRRQKWKRGRRPLAGLSPPASKNDCERSARTDAALGFELRTALLFIFSFSPLRAWDARQPARLRRRAFYADIFSRPHLNMISSIF